MAIITLNRQDFTADEWTELVTPRDGERRFEHARRVARALRIGCVTQQPTTEEPAAHERGE